MSSDGCTTAAETAAPEQHFTGHVDTRAGWLIRTLMHQRGLTCQGLADAMALAGIHDAPSRGTCWRIYKHSAVPQLRHQRALAQFFYGEDADPTRIWKVPR